VADPLRAFNGLYVSLSARGGPVLASNRGERDDRQARRRAVWVSHHKGSMPGITVASIQTLR